MNYNAFGIAALSRLSSQSKTENVFISPVSIGIALAMAADGAQGKTRTQMLRALEVGGDHLNEANAALLNALRENTDAAVGLANALWTREDIQPSARYADTLARQYGARAQALHFGDPAAARAINAWTKAHTLGLIDKIVGKTDRSDFLYLTNALAFKANWTLPFKKSRTRPMPFTNADGRKSTVQMMSQDATFETGDASDYSVLRMPYGKGGYAAYVFLPHGNDVEPLVQHLTAQSIDRLVHSLQPQFMQVSVPRFTAKWHDSLVPLLKALGMTAAFTGAADFSGIHAIPPRIAISSVDHASYVRVDEKGTTAAAATSVGMTMLAIRVPQKRFIVDHPFVLALRDEHAGALLFVGVIRTLQHQV